MALSGAIILIVMEEKEHLYCQSRERDYPKKKFYQLEKRWWSCKRNPVGISCVMSGFRVVGNGR